MFALHAISGHSFSQTIPVIDTIPAGDSIIILYDVTINPAVTSVSNQANISGTNFPNLVSDDPKTPAAGDATVTAVTVNNAPVVTTTSTTTAYTENGAALAVDAGITVSDADNPPALASATVSITGGFQASADVLSFTNQNGITGSYNSTTGVLILNGSSSVAN